MPRNERGVSKDARNYYSWIGCRHLGCEVLQEGNMRDRISSNQGIPQRRYEREISSCESKIVEAEKVLGALLRSMRR